MKITFLGTGTSQGIPVIGCTCAVCQSSDPKDVRLRSSIHIELNGKSIVIDTGPDFRFQMLRARITSLDAVFFTHEHKDHVSGLDDIRPFNYLKNQIPRVFCSRQVEQALRRDFHYAFAKNKYPGVPEFEVITIDKKPFEFAGEKIIPIEVFHHTMPVLGFRIQDFTYITDANFIADEELEKIKGTNILVINALRRSPHISHFSLDEALTVIQKIKPRKAYLTHISHQLDTHQQLLAELPTDILPAFDGLEFST